MSHGQLNLVSVGPGSTDLIPPMARLALERSDVVVGYGLYLQWIAPWLDGKEVHDLPLTKERERAALALRLAREGRVVSLVSSGDIGVYGLAPLVFEMLEAGEGTDIRVIPGITAALSCASLLGAPLGHDFATLSLSDLLCPWDWILGRAEQIAKTDIALALYNIQSEARREGVYRVLDILMKYRPRDTWCGVVRNAYREGAEVSVCTLAELRERRFDMLTTLIIGTRFTQKTGAYLFSPRGYHGWQFNDSPPKRAVWFFTGTRDGNALASEWVALGNSTVVSVASEFGADQARRQVKGAHVVTGGKGATARRSLFAASEVAAVVDATHPFATVISRQLIDHCAALGIPYLRYERPRVELPDDVQVFDSIEMAALAARSNYRRVFLATGVRHLSIFVNQPDSDHCQWFARVNPNSESISKALDSGILPARLCAMQGPFSQRANEVLWADWNIDCVVTKDSGDTGGLPAKIAAARALQIPLLIVRRPAMTYPDLTSDSSAVMGWLQKLSSESTKQLLTSI